MTIKKTDLLVKARVVTIYEKFLELLRWMETNSHVHPNDLLAEAMRDGLAECKTQSGIERFLAWQRRYSDRKEETGKAVPVAVDWSDAEVQALKELRKSQDPELTEVSFVSRCVEEYFKPWAAKFAKAQAHGPPQEPPQLG